jgi:DNA-binding transcriptional LysR family regulator
MRIEQLEYLLAVNRHGSLRQASEQMHVSQPALREAVSKLERELGVALLDRHRSGARVSQAGRDLLEPAAEILEAVARMREAAGKQVASRRLLRVGTVNAGTVTLLLPALRAFQAECPCSTVEILNLQQDDIYLRLAEGTLDVGLVNLLEGDDVPPELEPIPLIAGRPVAVIPAGHPLATRPALSVDELRDHHFVAMRARPLRDDRTAVTMAAVRRRQNRTPTAVRDMIRHLRQAAGPS